MIVVQGEKELLRKLDKLDKEAKKAIRKGTRAGSKIIRDKAKQLVPVQTGALRQSLKVRALPRSRKYIGTIVRSDLRYTSFVSLGTGKMDARPFLQQAAKDEGKKAGETALAVVRDAVLAEGK